METQCEITTAVGKAPYTREGRRDGRGAKQTLPIAFSGRFESNTTEARSRKTGRHRAITNGRLAQLDRETTSRAVKLHCRCYRDDFVFNFLNIFLQPKKEGWRFKILQNSSVKLLTRNNAQIITLPLKLTYINNLSPLFPFTLIWLFPVTLLLKRTCQINILIGSSDKETFYFPLCV